jgi:hypothetical protein
MNPDSNQNTPPVVATSLPVTQSQGQPGVPGPAQPPVMSTSLAEQVNERAKSLVGQYQQNPYHLCNELQQLKAQYLSEQFHISVKPAED